MSKLTVVAISAANVPNVEKFSKSDPLCEVEYQGEKKKTKHIDDNLNPEWNEALEFDLKGRALNPGDQLLVSVKDYEKIGPNKLIGQTNVDLKDVIDKKEMEVNVTLSDSKKRQLQATIKLKVVYEPPPDADKDAGGSGGGGGGGQAGSVAVGSSDESSQTGGGGARKARPQYSTKKQDFQIRIKVWKASQLLGSNVSPVCRVTCHKQLKMTRVKKCTNSPYWAETFFFNYNISPAELFDEMISFAVYDSRLLRSDALIGSFKFDIGMLHEERHHSMINRWLLLSDPEDAMAGAKGYLKFSAVVLGPGDEAPSFKGSSKDDDDDIEANLLRPAGVQLRPASFTFRLYHAEDLPRMDSNALQGVKKFFGGEEEKELVDPFAVVQFAGKEVKSSYKYSCMDPEWNEEMHIGLQFPSMCPKLKLQIYDWDRLTKNDPIAAFYIMIDHISSLADGDEGFLPTFGPCFVNLYGSPREFSDLPDKFEELNEGKGEGVAYRGRVLVELTTNLGEKPEAPLNPIDEDVMQRVQKYLRRRKFRLHAAFLDAAMVTDVDAPVEFEISMGNYGNNLDESVPPCSSTTQPTNAVFDGEFYHFLPWAHQKPCAVVECHWEDISYRMFAVNFILRITSRLESNLKTIRVARDANLPVEEQAQYVIAAFDDLIIKTGRPLPKWQAGTSTQQNDLDKYVEKMRESEMKRIREEVLRIREVATSVDEALDELDSILNQLSVLAIEPQNSMPDVVIWMICGDKRKAYYRIPAYDVLWSANEDYRGRFCGDTRTITLKRPTLPMKKQKLPHLPDDKDDRWKIPAQLRFKMWLGLAKEEQEWHKMQSEGELTVMAETYENETSILGKWCTMGPLLTRPHWSDSCGRVELEKKEITLPDGWQWDGEWQVAPEVSLFFDRDAGQSSFVEDVFVNEVRIPGGGWEAAKVQYTDATNDAQPALSETPLPEGWEWADEWSVDLSRPCDDDGWEYTVEASMGGYVPVEKLYHMCRRRRFIRTRKIHEEVKKRQKEKERKKPTGDDAAWEYAANFSRKFHAKEKKMDLVRRRRWHRKMKPMKPDAPLFFNMGSAEDEKDNMVAPRMFLTYNRTHKWQLRTFIFQACDLLGGDQNGFSDPYARVAFLSQSQKTEKIEKTVCPTWDQTLIFDGIEMYGDPNILARKPPNVVVEIFDYDTIGDDQFLGRCEMKPIVRIDPKEPRPPVLMWYPVMKSGREAGSMLAVCQLILADGQPLPPTPPRRGALYMVPEGVRPVMQRTGIEILAWGVRNMSKYQLLDVTSPGIEFEIGGHIAQTKFIKSTKRNPNFDDPLIFMDVLLPKEQLYMPKLNILVRDQRAFGRKPTVGMHSLKTMGQFMYPPLTDDFDPLADMPSIRGEPEDKTDNNTSGGNNETVIDILGGLTTTPKKGKKDNDEDIDWWSKYYASIGEDDKCPKYKEQGYATMEVYNHELEKVAEFDEFNDFCTTFSLTRREKNLDNDDDSDEDEESVGQVKGTMRIYPLPEDPSAELPHKYLERGLPDTTPVECVVRVYIIKAIELQPKDSNGLADPFVVVKLGKKEMDSKDDYIPNNLNPVFGRMFELKCMIPMQKDLKIKVMDYDLLGGNDLIGKTTIDLENRYLSKYRGTVGIPKNYCTSGPNLWRDSMKPKEILEQFCVQHHIPPPEYDGTCSVKLGKRTFKLSTFEPEAEQKNRHLGPAEERLALHVLNCMPVVKEHIETRPLYTPIQPGIEQGRLQMWVDIFPDQYGPPGPIPDVRPRQAKKYQLRIVIWNTTDVVLDEKSITGEQMSDIYVKGWIAGIDEKQETDVHYRSLDGDGNFNWRFVFPLDYLPSENCMVVKKKQHFWSLDTTEYRLPPKLIMQIWDNDLFSADDFLGSVEMDLTKLPTPTKKSRSCDLDILPEFGESPDLINMFDACRCSGFFPVFRKKEDGTPELTGKIECEMELISDLDAALKPAACARDDPNQNPTLEPPKRPETSFLWFTSPWKTFKFIVWRRMKYWCIGGLLMILAVLLVILFVYAVPGLLARKMVGV